VNAAGAPVLPGVTFEVERFEWTAGDRLTVVGRWFGLRGHRFLRPTLDVDVAGEHRRMLADLEHKPWAAEEGEEWVAAFRWRGEPARFEDAELTVSPDLAVRLPAPDNSIAEADDPVSAARLPAQPPRTARLEAELAAREDEIERLTTELARLRDDHAATLETASLAHDEALATLRRERDEARERLAALEADRDEARERITTAEVERDKALNRIAAAEAEAKAAAEARDEARAERNAWMNRAKAAALPPAPAPQAERPAAERSPEPASQPQEDQENPPQEVGTEPVEVEPVTEVSAPPSERRTIRIGERPVPGPPAPAPTPLRYPRAQRFADAWGARLVALGVLIVLAAIVLLVLTRAL
jgi:hypothetical protein